MSATQQLNLQTIREELSGEQGQRYWQSLEEIADTEEFREFLHREFPREAAVWDDGYSRRGFLKIMGASLALAGLSSCVKQPDETIIPYVKQPEIMVPGTPLYFATATVMGGYARGVLVTSNMGRPTKIEGNPDHPASLGSSDIFMQASILSLYDPDRSQVVTHNGEISTWNKCVAELQQGMEIQKALKGAGLRILTETVTSPTLAGQLLALLADYPQAKWHQYESVNEDNELEGAQLAFGEPVATQYHFEKADIVLSLDADFLTHGPAAVRSSRDFSRRRKVTELHPKMNRLYVAESTPSVTGSMADHRFRLRASEIEGVAAAFAQAVGVFGVSVGAPIVDAPWIDTVARDLNEHRGESIVLAGANQPPVVHGLAHAMNVVLGNVGTTVEYTDPVIAKPVNQASSLEELVNNMTAGSVDVLLVLGANPVYQSPSDIRFAEALEKVKLSFHIGIYADETAARCSWHIPQTHFLETWGDARAFDGTTTIMQPLIAPLYATTKSIGEFVEDVSGRQGRKGYDVVKEFWKTGFTGSNFEEFWMRSLHDGVVANSRLAQTEVSLKAASWKTSLRRGDGIEVMFRPDPSIWDGRFANNGWLQELPRPITKLTWDNAALISPATAEKNNLTNGDVVSITIGEQSIDAPVWIAPGHPDESVTLHLGYGRTSAGNVGNGVGFNANVLRTSGKWFADRAVMKKLETQHSFAVTQHHHTMEVTGFGGKTTTRHVVRSATVQEFTENPEFAKEMSHNPSKEESLYPSYEYDGNAWGMSIDLNACTGCNACAIACQSENNIPIVGKEQVAAGREMQWIRIDRYFKGDMDNPEVFSQPVMCMHCENAPCEVVCPVAATTHDSEGLNVMTYNRCVGTRYCSNNCPYKVRRFNFLQYSDTETETYKMMRNPDVTVRNRGVMEKCTYCVQRISHARIDAKKEDRSIQDGDVVTACQSACPAQAIVFGNINDRKSVVAHEKESPRSYGLLSELNTRPRTTYLAKLKNPNPELGKG